MNKSILVLVIAFVVCALLSATEGAQRVKRGGGGHGGGGYGHGAGSGGGAAGPVYFCGYVGKGEGSRYGGGYGRR